jgi:hypothetical protein
MRVRITCNSQHPLGSRFQELFTQVDYYSRTTGFDLLNDTLVTEFVADTSDYDLTVNFSNVRPYRQTHLLMLLNEHCAQNQLAHTVLNIGSYHGTAYLAETQGAYDVEKSALKYAHKKIAHTWMFHEGYLDSRLINFSFLETMSDGLGNKYKHINSMSLATAINNIKFMLDRPQIKEMSVQYSQPGNYRVNDGLGLLIPGIF